MVVSNINPTTAPSADAKRRQPLRLSFMSVFVDHLRQSSVSKRVIIRSLSLLRVALNMLNGISPHKNRFEEPALLFRLSPRRKLVLFEDCETLAVGFYVFKREM